MGLRALALLVILGLPSVAGAAEGLFHLCHGRVQLDLTCCCDHEKAAEPRSDAHVSGEQAGCCDELKASSVPGPSATAAPRSTWVPLPLAMAPEVAPAAPPAPELLPAVWALTRGVHRATAPPLYIQHCSYLI